MVSRERTVSARENSVLKQIRRYWMLYLLVLPGILFLLIFRYYPIFLQFILAFKNYKLRSGIWESQWVGLENFKTIFTSPDILQAIRNTINISLLRLLFEFLPPIILSIFLFDLTGKHLKRICQNLLYIPHFFSWTVMYAIMYGLFSNEGLVSSLRKVVGLPIHDYFMEAGPYLTLLIGSDMWKELGWSTIIYLAALTSINTELYEAATMDGAGPLQRIWYITLPGLRGVIVFLLILQLGNILRGAGTEQILLFYSPPVYNISDVIDTWVYRQGLGKLEYSLGSAVSLFQSTFGFVLVLICNKLANKYAGVGIW